MKNIIDYLKGVQYELSQVVWPKKAEVVRLTLVVFAISAIVAIYVGGLDIIMVKALETLISN